MTIFSYTPINLIIFLFRFQTHTGQYRKEKSNPDGSQEGTYGWVDPNGVLRFGF